ncbi:MAG: dihydroorotate dehydrogenase electron transfer subunit [Ignavibacteria bacterium]|nr:dihydroorotate dehydrogenase electron transfer subunit [Ignavibacteria bacterium]MBI3765334.1 dihydroorotate dehydrogenase electron transfer subunit [Ignavibacteriales bacterium]
MLQSFCPITSRQTVGANIYVLSFRSPQIASTLQPGQFVNIKVSESGIPLLRRPFSVYHTDGDDIKIIFNVIGVGTKVLASKNVGDVLDVLGPLGRSYNVSDGYETAVLVAGGLGVAPLPMITKSLDRRSKVLVTFLGARSRDHLVTTFLENVHTATDDGSEGFRGTVVELLRSILSANSFPQPKIFGCGPNVMLSNLSRLAEELSIPCEVSIECAMACGIGICQGCPIEKVNGEQKYALVCKEGPVFNSRSVLIV